MYLSVAHTGMEQYKAPTASYVAGVSNYFPRTGKLRMVESAIEDRRSVVINPFNAGITGVGISGQYAEFRWPAGQHTFLDLSKLVLEVGGRIVKEDGSRIAADANVGLIDGSMHTMIKSVSIFLNGQQAEMNPVYAYSSYLRLLTSMSASAVRTLGPNVNFYDHGGSIPSTYTDADFGNADARDRSRLKAVREHGFQYEGPLLADLASLDMYLLDNVALTLRIEFMPDNYVVASSDVALSPKIKLDTCRLHLSTVKARDNALYALNKSMTLGPLTYLFNKTLYKTFVLNKGTMQLSLDLPWGSVVPEKLYLMQVDLSAYSGNYARNPLHFGHFKLSKLLVSVNGTDVCNISAHFPHRYADLYYKSLDALGLEKDHCLDRYSFGRGRMIAVVDLTSESTQETIAVENSGALRVHVELSSPPAENIVFLLIGDSQGVLHLDSDRRVTVDVRA